jgi:hypothetical protein
VLALPRVDADRLSKVRSILARRCQLRRTRERRRGGLTPVAIVPASATELVVEFGPLRVRGLDVGGVAELVYPRRGTC